MALLNENDEDYWWIAKMIKLLSSKLGTKLEFAQNRENLGMVQLIFP